MRTRFGFQHRPLEAGQKERGKNMTYEKDIPDFALVPAREPEERVLIPITQGAIYSPVQVTGITEKARTKLFIEEDVLVPDTKPDLKEILEISGRVHLASREIDSVSKSEEYLNLTGDIELQTLYIPEKSGVHGPVISIASRIPFKEQWHTSLTQGACLMVDGHIENIDCMVINERKYRVKITLCILAREYMDSKIELFEGLTGENIQTLRETVEVTNVALRKKDIFTIKEDLELKEGEVFPQNILRQDITVVENYKQAASEKAVINGFVYVNLLYTGENDGIAAGHGAGEAGHGTSGAGSLHQLMCRVEFTQFIPLTQTGQWSGCDVCFDGSDLRVKLAHNEEGEEVLRLEGDILTWLILYRNIEKEIIVDGYHREKDFVCDFEEASCRLLIGSASGEATVREIIALDQGSREADRIIHVSADVVRSESRAEPGKIITEGTLRCRMICSGGGSETEGDAHSSVDIFSVGQEMPFRCVTAMPQLVGDEIITEKIYIKDLWAEKAGSRQMELNAAVLVNAEAMRQSPLKVLKNPAFEEQKNAMPPRPMAVYVVKPGDTLWSIARKFKSTVDSISQINQAEDGSLVPGQKLLVLR